ncbi:MAG: hypothetical protein ACLGI6_10275 [Gammaproteobacteria bacterium]
MRNRATPPQGTVTGAPIADEDARQLSSRLVRLGEQWHEICAELDVSGYGAPAAQQRAFIMSFARTEEDVIRLNNYWGEWAKERLAGLVGPVCNLQGRYPKVSAYRSNLMASLREAAAAGELKSEGRIVSPQIEPTLKRQVEMMPGDPVVMANHEALKRTIRQAALEKGLAERADFNMASAAARYDMLTERYRAALEPAGFRLDSHRKSGLVFRKLTSDQRWAFLLVDESRGEVDLGMLTPSFALTLPKKVVRPGLVWLNAVATFSPDDLVPGFRRSCMVASDSYAQLCLAADSISFLTRTVYKRLDRLLSEPPGSARVDVGVD